ncbi:MAG TPA: hypothetical protein VFJ85_04870 [Acidimicrobiales bacterium]|nr:hypothetical protein [Acidimicrobiales bacterium]
MKASDMCDVCGTEVPPGEGHREEVGVSGAMCPAPMVFHDECWAQASAMWQPDPDSYCEVDPRFPETAQWVAMQQQQEAQS